METWYNTTCPYLIYTTLLVPGTMKQNQSSINQKFIIHYKNINFYQCLSFINNLLVQLCLVMDLLCMLYPHKVYCKVHISRGMVADTLTVVVVFNPYIWFFPSLQKNFSNTCNIRKRDILFVQICIAGMPNKK